MASVYKRGNTWWVRFQFDGQEVRKSARTASKSEAREFLADLQAQYRKIALGGRPRVSFEDAVVAYMEEHFPTMRPQTVRSYQQSVRRILPEFKGKFLDEITRRDIAKFEAKERKRVSPSKVNHYRAALSGIFKVAIRHDWIETNPCRDLDPIKLDNKRFRYLSPAEWRAIRQHIPEPFLSIAEVSLLRGMRLGEIVNLEWRDINEDRDEIVIRDSKNRLPRAIPLEGAREVFRRQPANGRLIFPGRFGRPLRVDNASARINAAAKDAGIEDFTAHDLRHTYASWYVQRGGDLYRLQLILGHKSPTMTQRYAHLRTDDLRETPRSKLH